MHDRKNAESSKGIKIQVMSISRVLFEIAFFCFTLSLFFNVIFLFDSIFRLVHLAWVSVDNLWIECKSKHGEFLLWRNNYYTGTKAKSIITFREKDKS